MMCSKWLLWIKQCLKYKNQQSKRDSKSNTHSEQQKYRFDFRKAKDISDKIKDYLEFERNINWLDDYYMKDKPIPGGVGYHEVMHPDFNKKEILLYIIESDNKSDIIDIELLN
ncbi:MAG: hypothetical protein U9Q20_01865 [Campylobacterota bacterium]|nr:hypothetical protein [Campylobacterota bacterium]